MAMKADELKQKGNVCFQAGDFSGAEKFYTQAIIRDSTNAAFFTNRALARLKMEMFEDVINDCLKAIELSPSNMKAYSYLGQAQLALNHPSEALHSSMTAYELAITQRSPSVASIAAACLDAKKKRWEQREEKRRERECQLMLKMTDIIERDADRAVDELLKKGRMNNGNINISEQEEEIRHEAKERVRTLEDVFGKAEAVRCARREVPDYLIDNITFSIMLDPVITKNGHSYDRATLLDHLRRSQTDPLTREPLSEKDLIPNYALKAASDLFLKENGWAVDW
ncbi:uncharacterized protein LAJ45_04852 [Morchella importuna]|uniref:E3 ubiquitin-protein ligase CHIP n=1 Tax=Morchella conica CCBAS932 TaxID=1392247 RepID=A0A3N4KMS7_9PEZI|nr:uncharacterized protein LAJ45_04852 [Morchella importuna]KAH8151150.1 hypothetical protein LAJ45_04852 [Morchella importuna]RPB09651.1 U-box-domain-containing protein [Morchella conica CCBAS932]